MINKSIFALAAIAAVGVTALVSSSSSADARPRGGFIGKGGHFRHVGIVHRHHHHHWKYHRPYVYGAGVTAAIAAPAYAAAPKANPCLTKEYTKDKLVVFKDRCTKEIAATPVGGAPQQQQGAVPPQQQPEPGEAEPVPTK